MSDLFWLSKARCAGLTIFFFITWAPKTIYNRFIRWNRLGVFNKIFAALSAQGGQPDQLMIDATYLNANRTAASLLKKGLIP